MAEIQNQEPSQTVYVVDDDDHMRAAIVDILRSADMPCSAFGSASVFLTSVHPRSEGCLILDIQMPEIDGLEFQHKLNGLGYRMPIIFLTGFGDIPMTVQAMKAGAVDFLTKPLDEDELFRAISSALEHDVARRAQDAETDAAMALAGTLTKREKDVLVLVVKGLMNKQIAYELTLTEITVKLHRARIMKKLKVRTLPDLVRKAELIASQAQSGATTGPYNGTSSTQMSPVAKP
jgi:FixJ family two-component response regulator